MESNILIPKELRRFNRQMIIPEIGLEGQEKLKKTSALVIGAGGLGVPVLQNLSAAGVGRIGIVDAGMVDEDVMMRQTLFGDKELGKLRSIAAREKLALYNPLSEYEVINLKITSHNILKILSDYILVIDATNQPSMHFMVNDACIILGKPFVYGHVSQYDGQWSLFNYHGGPSLRCLYQDTAQMNAGTVNHHAGAIVMTYGITGTMMAWEAVNAGMETEQSSSGFLVRFHLFSYSLKRIPVKKDNKNFSITGMDISY